MGWRWTALAAAVVAWPWLLRWASAVPAAGLAVGFGLPALGLVLAARAPAPPSAAARRTRLWAHLALVAPVVMTALRVKVYDAATLGWVWLALFLPPAVLGLARTVTNAPPRPAPAAPPPSRYASVLKLHRSAAGVILAFVVLHLTSHLAAVHSLELNLRVTVWMRTIYKQPLVEALLLAAVPVQAVSGGWLVRNAWPGAPDALARLQVASGVVLALFVTAHATATAVLFRDLTFYSASGAARGLVRDPSFFAYYVLGVVAVFVHLAGGARALVSRRRGPDAGRAWAYGVLAAGAAVSIVISLALAGVHVRDDRQQRQVKNMRELARPALPRP